MIMKYLSIIFFLTFVHFFNISAQQFEKVVPGIDCVMLTIPGNPATTAAVTWQTALEDTISKGQLTIADASPFFVNEVKTFTGSHKQTLSALSTNFYTSHRIVFQGLKPETQYAYRVGNGNHWSEWFHFTTASEESKPFSLLYFGDIQKDILSLGARVIRQAYTHFPDSRFMIFAGDLVDHSTDSEWQEFFLAGGWIFGMVPSVPTPGNHEYYKLAGQEHRPFSSQWNQIFTLPANGPSTMFEGRVYYIDYQGVRFISIDSPGMDYNKENVTILKWLDQTLESNPNRWSVVFTHYPIYSCSQGRGNGDYSDEIRQILEKYGTDLVLQGHDHTYCRGQNLIKTGDDCKNPPMYVVSVAGSKMYGINASLWADRVASETQLYQHITFNEDTLNFKTFTATGELYDAFKLIKNDRSINQVVENPDIETIPERITIQKKRIESYTSDELKKIELRIKDSAK